ncbi:hypothetical protein PV325_003016 [Microctonus aethiopoides]|uniref:Uncharacterized protein n=1 Tax=Microctonus aethiopoides TaxID=144406 RepID=A0AA39FHX3_9HYME|nr:hypothetical protein PV325_003016 [Microctonus aethiopoides]KAK0169905.1 hypothetical protein PV328_010538 [Microctonus aethiopoides]
MSLANLIKTTPGSLNQGVWKRRSRGSDEDENNHQADVKKSRYWYVTLESESPIPTDDESASESIYSIQDEETEFARDTSDTSTSAWISTSVHRNMELQVEYDVASTSESENPFLDVSSSDPEDFLAVGVSAELKNSDLDLDRVEDTDESLTSLDSEISRADYWTCIQCNTTNNNPLFRYCERCYQLRKNFFPPRPKRKKRRLEAAKANKTELEPSSSSSSFLSQSTDITLSRIDSGLGSSQSALSEVDGDSVASSQVTVVLSQDSETVDTVDGVAGTFEKNQKNNETKVIESINQRAISSMNNNELKKTELGSIEFINSMELMQKKLKSDEENDSKFCLVCTVSPKNGAFVHGNVSHICCCYRCAIKVWKTTRHCPICQRKVTNVLKAFYV